MATKPTNLPEWCTSGIKRDPNPTMQERGWDTSDGTADGIAEKPTLEHTNGWMHNVCEFIKYLIPLTSDPVGTISVSMLTEQQMNQNYSGLWVRCDGRSCVGTTYANLSGKGTVPDLRNKYMVGAGTNTDGTYFADLLEEKSLYLYAGNSGSTLVTGGTQINNGGDVLSFPSALMTTTTSVATNNFTYTTTQQYVDLFYQSMGTSFANAAEVKPGGLFNASGSEFVTEQWPIRMDDHVHNFSFPPSESSLSAFAPGGVSPEDIQEVDTIDYADHTFMFSMKTNIFIRIN